MDFKLAAVVVPVADVDRARHFYRALGFRLDTDRSPSADARIVRLTPPGSTCSILIGTGIDIGIDTGTGNGTGNGIGSAVPGSARGLLLSVTDLAEARDQLLGCGLAVGPVSEFPGGCACAEFKDPDGNGWILVEAPIVATP
ncbi:VOC family protein [Kribbella sp. NPDC051718]|uniref:VOC family protein n=1 Tax=Kribbella sp. NPDC051718 TaxID=3155168 RepID=UPI003446B565